MPSRHDRAYLVMTSLSAGEQDALLTRALPNLESEGDLAIVRKLWLQARKHVFSADLRAAEMLRPTVSEKIQAADLQRIRKMGIHKPESETKSKPSKKIKRREKFDADKFIASL